MINCFIAEMIILFTAVKLILLTAAKTNFIYYCYRSDGMPTEAVVLPSDSPFYLFQYKRDMCQKVANMQVHEEWLRWDDEDFLTPSKSELGAVHPGMEFWNEATGASGSEIYYCHYTPQTK